MNIVLEEHGISMYLSTKDLFFESHYEFHACIFYTTSTVLTLAIGLYQEKLHNLQYDLDLD